MTDLIFYTGFSLLLVHELDAVKQQEWRIFPGLSKLDPRTGYLLFATLHIPLFIWLLWMLAHPSAGVRLWFQICVDLFLVIHLGLHRLFASHEKNRFNRRFSKIIIRAAAFAGVLHLLVLIFS